MDLRAFCEAAPDGRHNVEGDHHGEHHICIWCDEFVVLESGRYVTATTHSEKSV